MSTAAEKKRAPHIHRVTPGRSNGNSAWQIALQELVRRKTRAIVAICGYGLTVATFTVFISLLQYAGFSSTLADVIGPLTKLTAVFIVLNIIQNSCALLIERKQDFWILRSMNWPRKRIIALIGWERLFESTIGSFVGYTIALVFQIFYPARCTSRHLLCSIDFLKISLIGIGLTMIAAIVSGLVVAWHITAPSLPKKRESESGSA